MTPKNDDHFGGLFDLDGDGTTDAGEEYLAYGLFGEEANAPGSSGYATGGHAAPDAGAGRSVPSVQKQSPAQQEAGHISAEQFKRIKRGFVRECLLGILFTAAVLVVPGLLIAAATHVRDVPKGSGSNAVLLCAVIGFALVFPLFRFTYNAITSQYRIYAEAKALFLKDASESDTAGNKKP